MHDIIIKKVLSLNITQKKSSMARKDNSVKPRGRTAKEVRVIFLTPLNFFNHLDYPEKASSFSLLG